MILISIYKGRNLVGRVVVATLWEADCLFARYMRHQIMQRKYHGPEITAEFKNWSN